MLCRLSKLSLLPIDSTWHLRWVWQWRSCGICRYSHKSWAQASVWTLTANGTFSKYHFRAWWNEKFCFVCSREHLLSNLSVLNLASLYLTKWKCGTRMWVCSQNRNCDAFVLREPYAREIWIAEKLTPRLGWGLACKAEGFRVPGLHSLPLWRSWLTNAEWTPFIWNLKQLLGIF